MIDRLRGKLRRLRTRLAMQAALRNRFLWRLFSRGFRRAWSQRADGWDHMVVANAHTWFLPLDAALSTLPERWSPTQAVDVGGGTGRAGFHVAARYPEARVVVIDLAPGMVAFGRARQQAERLPPVHFLAGDSTALPLRSEAFDLAYVMNAPSNVDELRRVLRPGGVAVLAFTYGHRTPLYLDSGAAERFLRRAGFREIQSGRGGEGTYTLGRLPGG
jgi:ubiquinone/menaquinone biosynthesis C-methylase UbiE